LKDILIFTCNDDKDNEIIDRQKFIDNYFLPNNLKNCYKNQNRTILIVKDNLK
jgi:hypothetical protein